MKWVLVFPGWLKRLAFRFVSAITFWPFILVKHSHLKADERLICHEMIHLRQQVELLVLPFYLWYLTEYLVRLIQYRNRHQAYVNISFEREAYAHESTPDYLSQRKFWAFLRFLSSPGK